MKAKNSVIRFFLIISLLALSACAGVKGPSISDTSADELVGRARASLHTLYATTPEADKLRARSVGILVFPDIFRAGLIVGGSGGNGVLFSPEGRVMGYYNAASVSFGLQAGAEEFAQAMFLTTADSLSYLDNTAGWSVGVGPTFVVVDEGMAKDINTTTLRSDVYAFIYGQEGLMGGIGVQGQKITRLRN